MLKVWKTTLLIYQRSKQDDGMILKMMILLRYLPIWKNFFTLILMVVEAAFIMVRMIVVLTLVMTLSARFVFMVVVMMILLLMVAGTLIPLTLVLSIVIVTGMIMTIMELI